LKIVIIIPTYNEAKNIKKLTEEVLSLPIADINILYVDDNSPDGTGEIAEDLSRQYHGKIQVLHRAGKLGLGSAYIQGFSKAMELGAEAIGQMDADFSHPRNKLVEMSEALQECDVVIGSRYVAGGKLDENWPVWRKALSGWGNFYARTILNLPIRDVTGGFKLWRRETLANMPLERVKSNGYIFQVEMNYIATLLGYKFREIPIYFSDRLWGESKMSFKIQYEAAIRTWALPSRYKDLKKLHRK